ncbi:MAG: MmgE/PrpD family protein [Chloroflexi bacterium]|nr:MmgE/PrpD family protein [Chloroflexota bacterium]MBI3762180.1 MmgE/PrpD family protein [Chloroflexota bacterium]
MNLISFLHNTAYSSLPAPVRRRAAICLLDLIGTQIGGTTTRLSQIIRDFAAATYAGGEATLFFDGRRINPVGAALANGTTIDSLDIHDGHKLTKGHAGAGVFPAAAAIFQSSARRIKPSGEEFLTALVIGYEIGIRAGIALHATARDYHTSGAWSAIACAAIVARALGLNAEQTRHALGIAEYHGPRSQMMRVIDHPTMLKDGSGWGAMAGVSAGLLAANGFTGAPAITVEGGDLSHLWNDLGERWRITELYFKPHAVCRWAQPAMEGAAQIAREHGPAPETIGRVVVETFHEATRLNHPRPATTEEAQYSLPFPLAAALIHGNLGPREIVGGALTDPRVIALAERVELIEDAEMNAAFPANRFARVTVHTTDGRTFQSGLATPRGEPESPLTDEELEAKFRWLASGLVSSDRAEAIISAVRDLPASPNVNGLFELLIPPLSGA